MKFLYQKTGNGPCILIVHGWGGDINSLQELSHNLSAQFTVYNLEIPGHGELTEMSSPMNLSEYTMYIKQFIDQYNLSPVIYIGHSFGGKVGLDLAINHPQDLKKLVLINSSGIKPNNTFKKSFWKLVSIITKPLHLLPGSKHMRTLFYRGIIKEQDYTKISGNLKLTFQNIINEHIDPVDIKKITKPTLILWAEEDRYTPIWMGRMLKDIINSSEIKVFKSTHGLPLYQPKEVSISILDWLYKKGEI